MDTIENPVSVTFRTPPTLASTDEQRQTIIENRENQTKEMPNEVKPNVKVPPLSIYETVKGRPFSAEYFGMGNSWQFWNYPKEIAIIEDFVQSEIKTKNLTDTIDSYKDIVASLESKLNLAPTEKLWSKLDKVVSYIKALQMQHKWQNKINQMEGINA